MSRAHELFTLGYEGLSIDAFIDRLTRAGVETVVDVRELPLSRKTGFSKRGFAAALDAAGIAYTHLPALGCPKPIRSAYKRDADWPAYVRQFHAHLVSQPAAVDALAELAGTTTACLVCYEADARYCHRAIVARAVEQIGGLTVTHLSVDDAMQVD